VVILSPVYDAFTKRADALAYFNDLPKFYVVGPGIFTNVQILLGDCFLVFVTAFTRRAFNSTSEVVSLLYHLGS
jgi:hypothetical protein